MVSMHIQKIMLFAKRFNAVIFLVCFLVSFSISIFAGSYPVLPLNPPLLVEQLPPSKTIADVVSADVSFQTLFKALNAADLMQMLSYNSKEKDSYTIFAPTNDAFKLSTQGTDWWVNPANKDTVKSILKYHIVKGSFDSPKLKSGTLNTLEGSPVKIKLYNGYIKVETAEVVKRNIKVSNGVIHGINKVIFPPDIKL